MSIFSTNLFDVNIKHKIIFLKVINLLRKMQSLTEIGGSPRIVVTKIVPTAVCIILDFSSIVLD